RTVTHTLSTLFLQYFRAHPHLHSFPTRRSSDLSNSKRVRLGRPISEDTRQEFSIDFERRKPVCSARFDAGQSKSDIPYGFEASTDRKSTRLNSSHRTISYAVFCLKKKTRDATNH